MKKYTVDFIGGFHTGMSEVYIEARDEYEAMRIVKNMNNRELLKLMEEQGSKIIDISKTINVIAASDYKKK